MTSFQLRIATRMGTTLSLIFRRLATKFSNLVQKKNPPGQAYWWEGKCGSVRRGKNLSQKLRSWALSWEVGKFSLLGNVWHLAYRSKYLFWNSDAFQGYSSGYRVEYNLHLIEIHYTSIVPFYGCCSLTLIMAYGSTPYVGMTPKKNGGHIKSAQMTRSKFAR